MTLFPFIDQAMCLIAILVVLALPFVLSGPGGLRRLREDHQQRQSDRSVPSSGPGH